MSSSVTVTPPTKSNRVPSGSWDSPLLTNDMMRSESDVYWGYDPVLATVVMRRLSSYEAEADRKLAARASTSTPVRSLSPSPTSLRNHSESFDNSFANDTTLNDSTQTPDKAKSLDTSASCNSSPILHGLGVHGLIKPNGTPFDGTGVVGMRRSSCIARNDIRRHRRAAGNDTLVNTPEQSSFSSSPSISHTMIDELANAFTSSPTPLMRTSRRGRDRPRRSTLFSNQSTLPLHSESVDDTDDMEFFASIRPIPPVQGLGIMGITRGGEEAFDGTGVVGLRERAALDCENQEEVVDAFGFEQVSRVLVDEVAHTFSAADVSVVSSLEDSPTTV